ncbi:hypothetical protein EDD22DRAFT_960839 [Suillus occidentalis]|nr:hypothetical protein EDD22DRAFT_960839 [Suillus occidentalis]
MSPSPPSSSSHAETLLSLKRCITALEELNAELRTPAERKSNNQVLEGRVIQRLVCLTERVEDLVSEFDRRTTLGTTDSSDDEAFESSHMIENRWYRSYKKLVMWCPSVRMLIQSSAESSELAGMCNKLNRSADAARGDDTTSLKFAVASWLMQTSPTPNPVISNRDKSCHGFYHDTTGKLLCPVDYNWDDACREAIRNYHPDYRVTSYSWPSYLYRDGHYDTKNPTKGLFKGELLVKAVKHIFTSPTSAENPSASLSSCDFPKRRRTTGERCTRCDVAGLLGMKSIQPRAIAYTAVQLRFALSSAGSWRIMDDDFDQEEFYHNIVDYFELCPSREATKEVENLLLWWNQQVFGCRNVSEYRPQKTERLSVVMTSTAQ